MNDEKELDEFNLEATNWLDSFDDAHNKRENDIVVESNLIIFLMVLLIAILSITLAPIIIAMNWLKRRGK